MHRQAGGTRLSQANLRRASVSIATISISIDVRDEQRMETPQAEPLILRVESATIFLSPTGSR